MHHMPVRHCQVMGGSLILWHDRKMKKTMHLFKNHRYPSEIIQYAVWLYFAFPLSFRDVELLLNQRGIKVSHEAIRSWCYKFGPHFASQLRNCRRKPTDKWHLDEVFVTINGDRYYLWRAVDSEGMVLDILLQTRSMPKRLSDFSSMFYTLRLLARGSLSLMLAQLQNHFMQPFAEG